MDLTEKFSQFLHDSKAAGTSTSEDFSWSSSSSIVVETTQKSHARTTAVEISPPSLRQVDIAYLQHLPSSSSAPCRDHASPSEALVEVPTIVDVATDSHYPPIFLTTHHLASSIATQTKGLENSYLYPQHGVIHTRSDTLGDAYSVECPLDATFVDVLICDAGDGGGGALAIATKDFFGAMPSNGSDGDVVAAVGGNGGKCGSRRSARVHLPQPTDANGMTRRVRYINIRIGKGGSVGRSKIVCKQLDTSVESTITAAFAPNIRDTTDGIVQGDSGSSGGKTTVCFVRDGERPIVIATSTLTSANPESTSFVAMEGNDLIVSNAKDTLVWNKYTSTCCSKRSTSTNGDDVQRIDVNSSQRSVHAGGIAIGTDYIIRAESAGSPPRLFRDKFCDACLGYPSPLNEYSIRSTWAALTSVSQTRAIRRVSDAHRASGVLCYGGSGMWPGAIGNDSECIDGALLDAIPCSFDWYPFGMGGSGAWVPFELPSCISQRMDKFGVDSDDSAKPTPPALRTNPIETGSGYDGFCVLVFGRNDDDIAPPNNGKT